MNVMFNQHSHIYYRKSIYCIHFSAKQISGLKNPHNEQKSIGPSSAPLRHGSPVFIADYT